MSKADRVYFALQRNAELKTPRLTTDSPANLISPPVASEEIGLEREDMELDETIGSRAPTAREYGGRTYEGDIEFAARADTVGVLLSMVFGAPTSTSQGTLYAENTAFTLGTFVRPTDQAANPYIFEVTTAGTTQTTGEPVWPTALGATVTSGTVVFTNRGPAVYRHVWNPIASGVSPLPASIWTANKDVTPSIIDKFIGALGNEFSCEIEANGYLMATLGVVAAILDQTAAEPTGIAQDTTKKWAFHQVGAEISVAGGALADIPLLDFGLDYSNNIVTDQFVLGSKEVENLPTGNIEPEVTFTPAADISGHYRRALLDTPEDVRILLKAEGATISGTYKYTFELDLKRLQYTEAPVDIDAGESLTGVEVTAIPVLNDAATEFMTIAVVNSNNGNIYRAPTT